MHVSTQICVRFQGTVHEGPKTVLGTGDSGQAFTDQPCLDETVPSKRDPVVDTGGWFTGHLMPAALPRGLLCENGDRRTRTCWPALPPAWNGDVTQSGQPTINKSPLKGVLEKLWLFRA